MPAKTAGINMEQNYVPVTLCITSRTTQQLHNSYYKL